MSASDLGLPDESTLETMFQDSMSRIRSGADYGEFKTRPNFDPKQDREFREEMIGGRKIDDFKRALENAGFVWIPRERLPLYDNGQPHAEGEWHLRTRPEHYGLRLAMTNGDILAWFPGGPVEFWHWFQETVQQARASAAGLVIAQR